MTTQLSTQNRRIIVELESTYGVDAVDAALTSNADIGYEDSITAFNLTPEIIDIPVARSCASFSGTASERLTVGLGADIEFNICEAENVGVASGEAPKNRALLQISRMLETITGATSAEYQPTSGGDHKSASIYFYERNTTDDLWRMTYLLGFRGNLTLNMPEKGAVTGSISGKGITYPDETNAVSPSNADYRLRSEPLAFFDANGAPALDKNGDAIAYAGSVSKDLSRPLLTGLMKFTVDGVDVPIKSATLNQNYSLVTQENSGGTSLVQHVDLLRDPTARAGGEATLVETGDAYKKAIQLLHNGNEVTGTFELYGPTTKYTITMPKLQVIALPMSDESGKAAWTVGFALSGDYSASPNGDNEYTITVEAR